MTEETKIPTLEELASREEGYTQKLVKVLQGNKTGYRGSGVRGGAAVFSKVLGRNLSGEETSEQT